MKPRGSTLLERVLLAGEHVDEVRVWLDVGFGPSEFLTDVGHVSVDVIVGPSQRPEVMDWSALKGLPVQVVTKADTVRSIVLLDAIKEAGPSSLTRTVLDGDLSQVLEAFA